MRSVPQRGSAWVPHRLLPIGSATRYRAVVPTSCHRVDLAAAEHVLKCAGIIRDDSVDPDIDQSLHLFTCIDRPAVYHQILRMGFLDKGPLDAFENPEFGHRLNGINSRFDLVQVSKDDHLED